MGLKSFDQLNTDKFVVNLCKEELEVADQVRDITLDYHHNGIRFIFQISYIYSIMVNNKVFN